MEQVRTRDFIYTTDGMYFASTNYIHPEDRYISFLRYIPDENGDREKDGIRYYILIQENPLFVEGIFVCEVFGGVY